MSKSKISFRSVSRKIRNNWGQTAKNLPLLDLTAVQKESYLWLVQEGLSNLLNEISPVEDFTGKNWNLSFGKNYFDKSKYTPDDCLEKGLTYDSPLKVEAILTNKQTGRQVRQEDRRH